MTSGTTSSAPDDVTFVFLDANVLAKPVTRTILMRGAARSGFTIGWSARAEAEAARHMRPRAIPPAEVRRRYGGDLMPTGDVAGRFEATTPADRQILADADAAGARFLITEDVVPTSRTWDRERQRETFLSSLLRTMTPGSGQSGRSSVSTRSRA